MFKSKSKDAPKADAPKAGYADIPEKKYLNLLRIPLIEPWEPKDDFLKQLKVVIDKFKACEHPRHVKLMPVYDNVFNMLFRLCDHDEHYLARLIAAIVLIQRTKFNITNIYQDWVNAYLERENAILP